MLEKMGRVDLERMGGSKETQGINSRERLDEGQRMRAEGALHVVASESLMKPQTLEAWKQACKAQRSMEAKAKCYLGGEKPAGVQGARMLEYYLPHGSMSLFLSSVPGSS
jgi:hypothetical protein